MGSGSGSSSSSSVTGIDVVGGLSDWSKVPREFPAEAKVGAYEELGVELKVSLSDQGEGKGKAVGARR